MSTEMNFEQIKNNLLKLGSESSPSEAHGTLCGLLCAKEDIDVQQWLTVTLDVTVEDSTASDLLAQQARESLTDFFSVTVTALADNNLSFYPLLPPGENEFIRLEAIGQWAQGYLMGLSLGGIKNFSDFAEEVTEFVEAMASISNAYDYDLAGDESDEEAIIELVEFIRIGVLLMNEEMNPVRVPIDIPEGSQEPDKKFIQ